MFCKECGKEIDNDSKFCSFCGAKQAFFQGYERNLNSNTKPDTATHEEVNPRKQEEFEPEKYDRNYKRDIPASIMGLLVLLVASTILAIQRIAQDENLGIILAVILVIWWVISLFWVIDIARKQNRSTIGWGIFAFCFPFAAIIIIGFLKKLNKLSHNLTSLHTSQDQNPDKQSSVDPLTFGDLWTKISYEEKVNTKTSSGLDWEIQIKFSDGNIGHIFSSNIQGRYHLKNKNWRYHYKNKEDAIKALYYFLSTDKILRDNSYLYFE
ncbi:MAG: zinc-ribbon domain-containing protein [Candidatus Methanofastidiosa archaeon]|nr:zinc-ribbon domain-containing protein [Candidatus Methanofastidiosa archaeon]